MRSFLFVYENFVIGIWVFFNDIVLFVVRLLVLLFEAVFGMVFFGVFVILLLLGGIIGWLFKVCWGGSIEKVCYLFLFIVVFGVFWLFIGSGIFWYGFLMLVILMVFFVYGV